MGAFSIELGLLSDFLVRPGWPARLRRLTSPHGMMRWWMKWPEDCVAVVAVVGDWPAGWALAIRNRDPYTDEPFTWTAGWYVATRWRRKGFARALTKALMAALPAHVTRLRVQPGSGAVLALMQGCSILDEGRMMLMGREPVIDRWRVVRIRDES